METQGFYKNDNGMILYGPNFVDAGSFLLLKEEKDTYTYPIGGWYWFDSKEDAYGFWNLPVPPDPIDPNVLPQYPIDPNPDAPFIPD